MALAPTSRNLTPEKPFGRAGASARCHLNRLVFALPSSREAFERGLPIDRPLRNREHLAFILFYCYVMIL
jgi:hypothetical protein